MENRDELKLAIKDHLVKMMAEEIAKEANFEGLKKELVRELSSFKSKAPAREPIVEPVTEHEKNMKAKYGFFLKEDFANLWAKRLEGVRNMSKLSKENSSSDFDSFDKSIFDEESSSNIFDLPQLRQTPEEPSFISTPNSEFLDRIKEMNSSLKFDVDSTLNTITPPVVDKVVEEPLKIDKKLIRAVKIKKAAVKKAPAAKKVKKVTAGKKPKK